MLILPHNCQNGVLIYHCWQNANCRKQEILFNQSKKHKTWRHIFLHRVEKWSSHLSNISYRYLKILGYFNRIRTPDLCSTNYTKPGFYTLGIFKRQECLNCPSKYKYHFSVLYTELKFKCINCIYISYILIFFVLVCCLTSFWYLVNIAIAQF